MSECSCVGWEYGVGGGESAANDNRTESQCGSHTGKLLLQRYRLCERVLQ